MTVLARTVRTRPATHAYVVPVVRELAPPQSSNSGTLW
jgi:hypothetical protein